MNALTSFFCNIFSTVQEAESILSASEQGESGKSLLPLKAQTLSPRPAHLLAALVEKRALARLDEAVH